MSSEIGVESLNLLRTLTSGMFGFSREYSTALYTNANEPTTTRKQFKMAIKLRFISRTGPVSGWSGEERWKLTGLESVVWIKICNRTLGCHHLQSLPICEICPWSRWYFELLIWLYSCLDCSYFSFFSLCSSSGFSCKSRQIKTLAIEMTKSWWEIESEFVDRLSQQLVYQLIH